MKVKNNKLAKLISFIIFIIVYLIYIFSVDFNSLEKGYYITVLLPLVYICCFYVFLLEPVIQKKTPFLVLFSCVAFVRYVILSIATINNGSYMGLSGIAPSSDNLTLAGILMCWELIISSALINYWSKKKIKYISKEKQQLFSRANPMIYIMFILIVVVSICAVPQARKGLSFFTNINRAVNEEIGSLFILGIRECFINAKYFLLITVIIMLQGKNNMDFSKKSFLSYICILAVCIIIIGFRIGTNRKKMLSDGLAVVLILWRLFPKYKKTTTISIILIAILLVAVTTVYRGMIDSISGFFSEYVDLNFLQPYFLGQYNIAIAIEAVKFYPNIFDINTYLFSFLRPLFGIGSIVKNIDFTMAANLFDMRMSEGLTGFRGDQILPMIGEGYMLFGIVFSPIFSVITVRIGIFFDSLYSKSKSLEKVLISSIISFYLAQGMILNSTIILNMLSYKLAIYIIIVYLGYISVKKTNKNSSSNKSIGANVERGNKMYNKKVST